MPYIFLLPVFTKDILFVDVSVFGNLMSLPVIGPLVSALDQSSARQGLLISISGLGALAGALIVASMPSKRRGLIFLFSLLLAASALICFSATSSYLVALIIFIPLGFGQAGRMALSNTLLQSYSEDAYRGRVMSIYMMNWGLSMVGVFVISIAADIIGVRLALGRAAGLLALITLWYLFFSARIRRLD